MELDMGGKKSGGFIKVKSRKGGSGRSTGSPQPSALN
jgi:hypothetical protein